jgi:hypothetical protein
MPFFNPLKKTICGRDPSKPPCEPTEQSCWTTRDLRLDEEVEWANPN